MYKMSYISCSILFEKNMESFLRVYIHIEVFSIYTSINKKKYIYTCIRLLLT